MAPRGVRRPFALALAFAFALALGLALALCPACRIPAALVARVDGGPAADAGTDAVPADGGDAGEPACDAGFSGPCSDSVLAFDGSNDFVQVAGAPALDPGGPFTLEAWVRVASPLPAEAHVVSHHDHDMQLGWVLMVRDAQAEFRVYSSSVPGMYVFARGGALIADEWHHLAGVFDGAAVRLFVDGIGVATTASAELPAAFTGPLRLGAAAYASLFHFPGLVDDVRLSTGPRYAGAFCPPAAPLAADAATIALWSLNETGGQIAVDAGPNGLDGRYGTATGADTADPLPATSLCAAAR